MTAWMRRATKASVVALALTVLALTVACGPSPDASDKDDEPEVSREIDRDPQPGIDAYNAGQFSEAEQILADVVAADAQNVEARKTLALALCAQGKNEEAIEQYEAVIERESEDHVSLYRMALLERLAGDPEQAAEHLERAVELWDDDSYLDELARTCMQLERFQEAADTWAALASEEGRAPENAAQLLGLQAQALQSAGDTVGARTGLERALELAPDDARLKAQLEGLGN